MAPTGFLGWVKSYLPVEEEVPLPPPISTLGATGLLLLYTFFYVAPFYISSTTRPSPQLSRDAPSVIRGRITTVIVTCIICSVTTFVLLSAVVNGNPVQSLHDMGWFPPGIVEAASCLSLTAILFLGPLFEVAIAEGAWRDWIRLRGLSGTLGSWIGYRNIIAGPITEEILFRSASVPLFILAQTPNSTIIFLTPIIFGLAHIHHFYEFRLTHPHTPILQASLRSIFQLSYTSLFGAYATFLYLRTGSLLAVILVHAFCNWMGLPRFWGRIGTVEPLIGTNDQLKRNEGKISGGATHLVNSNLGLRWTFAYYILLVVGAYSFYLQFWPFTESSAALAKF